MHTPSLANVDVEMLAKDADYFFGQHLRDARHQAGIHEIPAEQLATFCAGYLQAYATSYAGALQASAVERGLQRISNSIENLVDVARRSRLSHKAG